MMKVKVRKSRLTGHWIVDPDRSWWFRQGFRNWSDAVAEANERSRRRNELWYQLSGEEYHD